MAPIQVGQVFKSFEEFEEARKQYEMLNHMKWVTKSTSSISQENKIRAADGRPLMNPNLKHKNIKFICKFGGVARKKSKGLRTHLSREEDVRRVSTAAQVKRRYISNSSDPVVDEMVNHLTWFASDLIMWEKAEAAKAVVRPSTTVTSCDCSHFINYVGLPCRHIIKMRIDEDLPWYDSESYHPRWKLSTSTANRSQPPAALGRVVTMTVPEKVIPKTGPEKFTKAMTLLKKMANVMAASGDLQFGVRYKCMSDIFHQIWAKGHEVHLSSVVDDKIVPLYSAVRDENAVEATNENRTAAMSEIQKVGTSVSTESSSRPPEVSRSNVDAESIEPIITALDVSANSTVNEDPESSPHTLINELLDDHDDTVLLAAITEAENTILKPPSMCFCNVPAIRLNTTLTSKMKGNPFFKCKENACKFWQTAPKMGGPKRPRTTKKKTDGHDHGGTTNPSQITSEPEPGTSKSIHIIEAKSSREEVKAAIGRIVIPPSIKHKGRPKGLLFLV
ncbi:hypothetical protein ONE63_011390 [Megalurothrips usitatus]|uniref:SWIM-type domain-containing protein n=1 Tax=Megalurothrips usitatus TaxID=439358 RepID=A0AAV7X377_9NEOP|nr:hypothetical protein ONE63_011390 [Megalurothrips usitatus]